MEEEKSRWRGFYRWEMLSGAVFVSIVTKSVVAKEISLAK
jgi:hypothetical protein